MIAEAVQSTRLSFARAGIFNLSYIFANFAPQFPEKQGGEFGVDGGFFAALADRQTDERSKQI
jgi:hypothetical protein